MMESPYKKLEKRKNAVISYIFRENRYILQISSGLFAALFTLGILYRLRIHHMIQVDTAFMVSRTPTFLLLKGLFNEALFALTGTAVFWVFLAVIHRLKGGRMEKSASIIITAFACILVAGAAFLYNTSFHFWVSMNTGLTRDLILESLATTKLNEAAHFLKPADAVFFTVPIVVLLLHHSGRAVAVWRNRIVLSTAALAAAVYVAWSAFAVSAAEGGMARAPLYYTIASFFERDNWNSNDTFRNAGDAPADQERSVELIDERFVSQGNNTGTGTLRYGNGEKWNILYIVMESIGKEYIFNTKKGNRVPMPFYHELTKKGLYFDYHYSTGNTSPRSLFSMLSGLYPSPRVQMFCTKPDVVIPSLRTFLGEGYDAFFVTPGSLDWFFPKGFMRNSGFRDLYGYSEIPGRIMNDSYGKNDIDAVTFFIERLKKTDGRPFIGVYYSFAAHWPYVDYGEDYRIFSDTRNRLNRYYNNIHMLDHQIKRIYDHLAESGQIDRTILVILSDHGEAFNQHPGVWVHSRDSYNENFSVPALLYQPRLFRPARITFPTTHADIVPTLLDAMGIRYNRRLMQGESILENRPRRKYIFLFGNENTMTSISAGKIKLQYSLKDKSCWVFDLNRDPGELRKLPCDGHREQMEAMMQYHRVQPKILESYNSSLEKGTDFHGQRHYSMQ